MARKKRYESAAAKQKAYRERKRMRSKFSKSKTVFTHGTDAERPSTVEQLRELVEEVKREPVEAVVESSEALRGGGKPQVYRNDYGAVISERAFSQLQERKRRAKEGGYVLDEYSQT